MQLTGNETDVKVTVAGSTSWRKVRSFAYAMDASRSIYGVYVGVGAGRVLVPLRNVKAAK